MERQPNDIINYGPDRSKISPTIGKHPNSAFTKIERCEYFKLKRVSKKVCCVIC
jgi:hypothetical protein|uniref:Uncharacterized protein n=1 Tax=viral metagenome TaxID=1070528 RepID=A0A6C0LTT2_9ZZZZ